LPYRLREATTRSPAPQSPRKTAEIAAIPEAKASAASIPSRSATAASNASTVGFAHLEYTYPLPVRAFDASAKVSERSKA
jgi:hypothetical protein